MSVSLIVAIVLVIGAIGYYVGYSRANKLSADRKNKMHSRSSYHGSYVFTWAVLPSLVVLALCLAITPAVISRTVSAGIPAGAATSQGLAYELVSMIGNGLRLLPPEEQEQARTMPVDQLRPLLERRGIAVASSTEDYMVALAIEQNRQQDIARLVTSVVVILLAIAGAVFAAGRVAVRLRARNQVESVIKSMLIAASSVAILTTVGIISSMVFEASDFFGRIPANEFFFGIVWDPGFGGSNGGGQFGLIPLLAGTLYIAAVAMLVAVPIGLFAAIYMAEYASNTVRSVVKPLLEVLAGIPTIVYGFFALITVGPFLRDLSAQISGLITGEYTSFIRGQSVITAGLVMGVMLIPFVSSLSDDIITAVPRSLRDGSLGLGATRSETIKRVVLPAALPGIMSACLLTASRAIGETMIVVLAAGVAPNLTANPFEAMTTVTVKIVNQLTGDLEFNSPQTLVAFALGMTLFVITLCLNIFALYIVRKYREQYE